MSVRVGGGAGGGGPLPGWEEGDDGKHERAGALGARLIAGGLQESGEDGVGLRRVRPAGGGPGIQGGENRVRAPDPEVEGDGFEAAVPWDRRRHEIESRAR